MSETLDSGPPIPVTAGSPTPTWAAASGTDSNVPKTSAGTATTRLFQPRNDVGLARRDELSLTRPSNLTGQALHDSLELRCIAHLTWFIDPDSSTEFHRRSFGNRQVLGWNLVVSVDFRRGTETRSVDRCDPCLYRREPHRCRGMKLTRTLVEIGCGFDPDLAALDLAGDSFKLLEELLEGHQCQRGVVLVLDRCWSVFRRVHWSSCHLDHRGGKPEVRLGEAVRQQPAPYRRRR
jgi:hypothetical protein